MEVSVGSKEGAGSGRRGRQDKRGRKRGKKGGTEDEEGQRQRPGRAGEAGLGGRGDGVGSRTLLLACLCPSLSPGSPALAHPGPASPPRRLPTSLTRILLAFAASPRWPPQREARHWPLGPLQIAVLPAAPRSHTVLPFLPHPLRPASAFSAPGLLRAPTDPLLFSLHVQSLRVRDLSTSCTPSPW